MSNQHGGTQWLRGVLDLCALAVLAGGEQHGYGLAVELERAGIGKVKGGTLYPMLARLEKEKLVSFRWEPGEGGPARKLYEITESGRSLLEDKGASWLGFTERVRKLLEEAEVAQEGGSYEAAGVSGSTGGEFAVEEVPRREGTPDGG